MLDTTKIRSLFPYLREVIELRVERPEQTPRVALDNGASTQLPVAVLERMAQELFTYSNIHRGEYNASVQTTEHFERAYNVAANFVNAASWREIVMGRNTTEMINLVMRGLEYQFRDGDNVVVSALEHNSNYVPWYALSQNGAKVGKNLEVRLVEFDPRTGQPNLRQLQRLVDRKTKLVGMTGASNFIGVKPDLQTIGQIAHASGYQQPDGSKGSYFLVDGAQLVPGNPVDVQALDCDFLAWSFHKMALPLGVGGLYARAKVLETLDPFLYGGDMVEDVQPGKVRYHQLPLRFMAGTPNILGVAASGYGVSVLLNIGLGNFSEPDEVERVGQQLTTEILMNTPRGDFKIPFSIPVHLQAPFREYLARHQDVANYLRDPRLRSDQTRRMVQTAMSNIQQHEIELTQRAIDGLAEIDAINLYGPLDAHQRASLIAFDMTGVESRAFAHEMNRLGVEVRNGVHCASLAHYQLGIKEKGSVRMSFYVYNDFDDVQKGVAAVKTVTEVLKV